MINKTIRDCKPKYKGQHRRRCPECGRLSVMKVIEEKNFIRFEY